MIIMSTFPSGSSCLKLVDFLKKTSRIFEDKISPDGTRPLAKCWCLGDAIIQMGDNQHGGDTSESDGEGGEVNILILYKYEITEHF